MFLLLAALTLLLELAIGFPDWLFRRIGHPVVWIGHLISVLERRLNQADLPDKRRKLAGVAALAVLVVVPAVAAFAVSMVAGVTAWGVVAIALVASSLIAQRSLSRHVATVADALDSGGVDAGRRAVSQIVGRDPERLDEAAVCRAAIESLAENFSDGVVAPTFWLCVGGLPGIAAYKAVNTADSMIGHRSERYRDFGWASARFDDLVNLPASRLSALLIIAAAAITPNATPISAWRAVWRDARYHRSPNAGWPEAAMAGALGISIAGPRHYGGVLTEDPEMGRGGRRDLTAADIRIALRLQWTADLLMVALVCLGAVAIMLHG